MNARTGKIILAAGGLAVAGALLYARSRPTSAALAPEDAALRRQAAGLQAMTPESVALPESQLAAAIARLPARDSFEGWLQSTCRHWAIATRAVDSSPRVEIRRYGLAYDQARLDAWPEIEDTVKALCGVTGLVIDRLAIAAAPDGSDAFQRVEIEFSVRLRP